MQVYDSEPKWCATPFLCGSHPLLHTGLSRRILDNSICPCQDVRRNRHTDLFCCFKIDDQLEFGWLLDWNIGWFGSFQDFVNYLAARRYMSMLSCPYDIRPPASTHNLSLCVDGNLPFRASSSIRLQ